MRLRASNIFLSAVAAAFLLAGCGGETPANAGDARAAAVQKAATGEMAAFQLAEAGARIPDMEVNGPDGAVNPIADDLAEVTLVNLWATWCAPCVIEMPALNALQDSYDPQQFRVVPISLDQTPEKAQAFYEKSGLDVLVFRHDPGFESASLFKAPGLPISVLYDAEGNEIGRINGPAEWDTDEARALIDAALASEPDEGA